METREQQQQLQLEKERIGRMFELRKTGSDVAALERVEALVAAQVDGHA